MFSKLLAKTCILPDIIVGPFRFTRKLSATVPDSYHDQFMLLAAGMVSTGLICRFNMPLSNCFRIPLHIVQRMKFHWRRYLHSAKLDTHQSCATVKLCPAFLPPTKQLPEMKTSAKLETHSKELGLKFFNSLYHRVPGGISRLCCVRQWRLPDLFGSTLSSGFAFCRSKEVSA